MARLTNLFLHICNHNTTTMKKIFFLLFFVPLFASAQQNKSFTHTVAAKESLSSIGRMYDVNPRELAKFNKIDYDKGLSLGQVLKIPGTAKKNTVATPKTTVVEKPTAQAKQTTGANPIYHTVAKKETLYSISQKYNKVPIESIKKWNHLTSDGLNEGAKLIVGYNNKKTANEDVVSAPVTTPVSKPAAVVEPTKKEPVVVNNQPAQQTTEIKSIPLETQKVDVKDGGFFKSAYAANSNKNSEQGLAGVFKSTSGWEDGKFYCLHNTAASGSIIKITNPATQKTIYARVLDIMPDLKQNNGLLLRLSNAAADALGAGAGNFECVVNY